jgi:hypothetical protein
MKFSKNTFVNQVIKKRPKEWYTGNRIRKSFGALKNGET